MKVKDLVVALLELDPDLEVEFSDREYLQCWALNSPKVIEVLFTEGAACYINPGVQTNLDLIDRYSNEIKDKNMTQYEKEKTVSIIETLKKEIKDIEQHPKKLIVVV